MRDTINILGVNIDMITMAEAVNTAAEAVETRDAFAVFTPNSEFIQAAYKDTEFRDILNNGDMCVPDGIGVVYASRILKKPIAERVAGYDLVCALFERMARAGKSVFLLGAKPGYAYEAGEKLKGKYPGLVIAGIQDGYFKPEHVDGIIDVINESNADVLLVCLGMKKQEQWMIENKERLRVGVMFGAGGCIDGFAGRTERAPEAWCNAGLEWLHRLLKEPWRLWRMMALPRFAITVFFRGKRY